MRRPHVSQRPGDVATRHLLARLLAVSPEEAVRDGGRAVELAQSVVDEHPALNRLETLAMALAEAGRFDDAVTWQQRALEAERQAAGGNSPQRLDRLALLPGPPAVAGALTASGAGLAAGASFWPPLAAAGQKTRAPSRPVRVQAPGAR